VKRKRGGEGGVEKSSGGSKEKGGEKGERLEQDREAKD